MNADAKSTFPERMNVLIESAGGPSALAQNSKLSRGVIEKYRTGKSDPSRERLIALASAAGVSVQWLATGEDDVRPAAGTDFVAIPRYDANLAAGAGAFNERAQVLDHIPFTKEFLAKKLGRSNVDGLVMLEARGDSMEPTIGDGDLVLVDQADTNLADGILAFVHDDTAYVKRVRHIPGGIEVISDNRADYPPYQLSGARLEEFRIIGRVRWIGRVVGR